MRPISCFGQCMHIKGVATTCAAQTSGCLPHMLSLHTCLLLSDAFVANMCLFYPAVSSLFCVCFSSLSKASLFVLIAFSLNLFVSFFFWFCSCSLIDAAHNQPTDSTAVEIFSLKSNWSGLFTVLILICLTELSNIYIFKPICLGIFKSRISFCKVILTIVDFNRA